MTEHVSGVRDGAIILLGGSAKYWMKVCSHDGYGGVVDIVKGLYIPITDLERYGISNKADIIADSLEEFICRDNAW